MGWNQQLVIVCCNSWRLAFSSWNWLPRAFVPSKSFCDHDFYHRSKLGGAMWKERWNRHDGKFRFERCPLTTSPVPRLILRVRIWGKYLTPPTDLPRIFSGLKGWRNFRLFWFVDKAAMSRSSFCFHCMLNNEWGWLIGHPLNFHDTTLNEWLGGGFKYLFYFHLLLREMVWFDYVIIFRRGWNHQPDKTPNKAGRMPRLVCQGWVRSLLVKSNLSSFFCFLWGVLIVSKLPKKSKGIQIMRVFPW